MKNIILSSFFHRKRPKPALFLHIQKTAGTSVLEVARQHYGASLTSHGDCWGHQPEEFKHVNFVSGHFGFAFANELISNRFSFTFLRNPSERILSLYYFCRGRDPNEFEIYRKSQELDLLSFLEAGLSDPWLKMHIRDNQVFQLACGFCAYDLSDMNIIKNLSNEELLNLAKDNIKKFSYIGFTENFDIDFKEICKNLNITYKTSVPRVNITENRPVLSSLSDRVKSLLDELTILDRQLYDYAWTTYALERRTIKNKIS